ncbi:MAG TPA: glucose-6-phosphate dehydrogenase assembly protein OpcA, partial [Dehalococcoidia bacterium]|nr:glucose-6-phosphate dehydrogenase assembly protein OpcA [Dehalococcoidia bacterium]
QGHGVYADQLHSLVPALVIPGVPLFVWWRGAPPLRSPMHKRLRQMSQRMIVDSSGFRDAFGGLADEVLKCGAESCAISDLAWGRLERWREQIADLFDPADTSPYLVQIERLAITSTTGAHVYPTEAVLLVSWLASRLGWQTRSPLTEDREEWVCRFEREGRTIECRVESAGGGQDSSDGGAIAEVVIEAGVARFELSAEPGGGSVKQKIAVSGVARTDSRIGMKPPDLLSLLSQELEMVGNDEVYEQAVAVGARLSGAQL